MANNIKYSSEIDGNLQAHPIGKSCYDAGSLGCSDVKLQKLKMNLFILIRL